MFSNLRFSSVHGNLIPILLAFLCLSCTDYQRIPPLKKVFRGDYLIGMALDRYLLYGRDSAALGLAGYHCNSITSTNSMKWERIHPDPGVYNFGPADRLVEFGEKHGMYIIGHTLIWHQQTPDWVFLDDEGGQVPRDTLISRMREHIYTVAGRYRGRVDAWDVVNEAVDGEGNLRETDWYRIIGDDFLELAFRFAREADPDAVLIYNDYSLPDAEKREGVVRLVRNLGEQGIKVDAIGMQAHYSLRYPDPEDLAASISAFSDLGCRVHITELDVSVLPDPGERPGRELLRSPEFQARYNPYRDSLPDSVDRQLAAKYEELFGVFLDHSDRIDRVTFWGVYDGHSWKNFHPVRGRTDYPLLFDRQYRPKPAFYSVIRQAG